MLIFKTNRTLPSWKIRIKLTALTSFHSVLCCNISLVNIPSKRFFSWSKISKINDLFWPDKELFSSSEHFLCIIHSRKHNQLFKIIFSIECYTRYKCTNIRYEPIVSSLVLAFALGHRKHRNTIYISLITGSKSNVIVWFSYMKKSI